MSAANFVRRSNGGLIPLSFEFSGDWNGIHAIPARIPFHPPEDGSGKGISPIVNIITVIFLRLTKIAYTKFSGVPKPIIIGGECALAN